MKQESLFRIVFESRELFRVIDENKTEYQAEMSGRLRSNGELWPAVGDWVKGVLQPGDWVQLTEVMDRHSWLTRKDPDGTNTQTLAANIDTLFIVTSANQDLSLNRLDRYVALAMSGQVHPVIVINKMELTQEPQKVLEEVASRYPNMDVVGVSAVERWNLDVLQEFAASGQTVSFVGSSGVGKSTLTNFLLGEEFIKTQEIRQEDGRGRHTTTHRELHVTPNNAFVIDTPGIRTVGVTSDTELSGVFADIEEMATRCRFSDCRHDTEPGCAILAGRESGALDEARWVNYLKMRRELEFERRKGDKAAQAEQKKVWIKRSKALRSKNRVR